MIRLIKNQLNDAISQRADPSLAKDSLQEQVFDQKVKLQKFVQEMSDLGFDSIDEVGSYIKDSTDSRSDPPRPIFLVQLSANTCAFAKSYLNTLKDLTKLCTHPTIVKQVNEVMVQGFKSQMIHMAGCLKKINSGNPELVRLNISWLLDRLIPLIIRKYCESLCIRGFNDLQLLSHDYAYLKESPPSSSAGRSGNNNNSNNTSSSSNRITTSFSTSSTPRESPFGSPVPAPRVRKSTTTIQVNNNNDNITNNAKRLTYSLAINKDPTSSSNRRYNHHHNVSSSPPSLSSSTSSPKNGNWTTGTYL